MPSGNPIFDNTMAIVGNNGDDNCNGNGNRRQWQTLPMLNAAGCFDAISMETIVYSKFMVNK